MLHTSMYVYEWLKEKLTFIVIWIKQKWKIYKYIFYQQKSSQNNKLTEENKV